jgi:hypothetical protein
MMIPTASAFLYRAAKFMFYKLDNTNQYYKPLSKDYPNR